MIKVISLLAKSKDQSVNRDEEVSDVQLPGELNSGESCSFSDEISRVSLAAPRFWHGMRFLTYLKLLRCGRFRIHYSAIAMAVAIFFYSIVNTCASIVQGLVYGRKIARTQLKKPPVFIVGHWRSGTTLVHELMTLDDQFSAPTTLQCFIPGHFLVTSWFLRPLAKLTMPRTRPMDNMASGPDRPQEDEFAFCVMGTPSPYRSFAFPNDPRPNLNMLDLVNVSSQDLQAFEKSMDYFCRALTLKNHGKRLILKSPTHTGRIPLLRKLFPGAKFIHICRDPKEVIPSTVRLWRQLDGISCFDLPRYERSELEADIGRTFQRMYVAFEKATRSRDDDLVNIRYEDLVEDPVASLGQAYQKLGLQDFDQVEPRIRKHMQSQADYKKNQHQLSSSLRDVINNCCAGYQEKYGYPSA